MKINPARFIWFCLAFALLGLAAGCSLAGDVTPPPDYERVVAQRETAQAPVMPASAPSVEMGQQVYERFCAECHGESGLGDGASASQVSGGVPALAEGDTLYLLRPSQAFQSITLGSGSMPAFDSMLTAPQRWDALAYLYHLAANPAQISTGQAVYQQNCQQCHGENGQGGTGVPALNDPVRLASLADSEVVQTALQGRLPGMPAFEGQLSEDDLRSTAAYLRTEIFSDPGQDSWLNPSAGTNPANGPTITGEVFNVTNSSATSGLQVQLLGLDAASGSLVYKRSGRVDAAGTYRFDNVKVVEGRTYVAAVTYQGVPYYSSTIEARELLNSHLINRPVEVYEASRDVSQLSVARRHIFFDFTADGNLQMMDMLLLDNPLNVAVIGEEDGAAVLSFNLPAGAQNLQLDDTTGQRFVEVPGGFVDFQPVQPGTVSQVLYACELPYRSRLELSLPVQMDTDQLLVIVPAGSLKLAGSQLTSMGSQVLDGVNVELYSAAQLKAGSTLNLTLNGRLRRGLSMRSGSAASLGIGLLVLGSVMALALYLYYRRQNHNLPILSTGSPQTPDEVMDAILALDDRYQAGKLNETSYQARRAELKERLRALLPPAEPSDRP